MVGLLLALSLPTYNCYRTVDPIVIDGVLNERTWRRVPAIEFVLWNGGKPKKATKAWLAWDDENLYLAFDVDDDDIQCTFVKRDENLWEEEVVELFVDADGDGTDYLEFEWNALGACVDLILPKPPSVRRSTLEGEKAWDAKGMRWKARAIGTIGYALDRDAGWQLEVAIPLKLFIDAPNVPPKDGDVWRINLYRIERPKGEKPEFSCWSPVLGRRPNYHKPERFGKLIFRRSPPPGG